MKQESPRLSSSVSPDGDTQHAGAVEAQQDPRAGAGEGNRGPGEVEQVEAELRGRGVEPGDAVGENAGARTGTETAGSRSFSSSGTSMCLRSEPGPDKVA